MIRNFVTRADAYGIDYNIIEAFDQPWKTFEGSVGPYWGLFDASRSPSSPGPARSPIPITGSLPAIAVAARRAAVAADPGDEPVTLRTGGAARARCQCASAHGSRIVFAFWNGHYFVPGAAFALGLGTFC